MPTNISGEVEGDRATATNPLAVMDFGQLVPEQYDELALGYTGDNLTTVVYKLASATVSTLTLGYTGETLISVVRS